VWVEGHSPRDRNGTGQVTQKSNGSHRGISQRGSKGEKEKERERERETFYRKHFMHLFDEMEAKREHE
jgi:hypothetical protein